MEAMEGAKCRLSICSARSLYFIQAM
ncbi:hypothetical protein SIAM614_22087 [Stappia aggregata IAM 12614]|uniref:Uncharacterized protein n=1 Tax=Roseibium aggregatum (strain ATCC 25650 / DSM 13394 / JCM 20685 / NBRC 16684 / NCIMB 2208 / IAM 12614 / B1) TaxID=384765 RepID=A0NXX3_ROSAI|nr:hypothetical protein SIAM614_22087 [Stappia aggregata IAM 12614] [Roseibium aggregatum IAM 12614]